MEPIQQLFQDLNEDFEKDINGPNVQRLMQEYVRHHDDWKEYMHFNEHKYARNLVNTSEYCELMIICWKPDQVSPIHNHAGQNCWAAVLEGAIKETYYKYKNTQQCTGCGPLEVSSEHEFEEGQVSYITDDIALHVLQPVGGQRGITLHLYSRPIEECNIYCERTGKITRRKLGFYTINKQLQAEGAHTGCSAE